MIEIVKLPDDIDIESRIRRKMLDVYGTCPYCRNSELLYEYKYDKESKEDNYVLYLDVYCETKPINKGLFRKRYEWEKYMFSCHRCGMKWNSPEFPVITCDAELNKVVFDAWRNGEDTEVKTLLLGVVKNDGK